MQSTEDKIYMSIRNKGMGCVVTNSDFYHRFNRKTVSWVLNQLRARGIIRLLLPGVFDYPLFSELLQEQLAPDIEQVARAIARKNQWHIQITGASALNYLGLSTQVPGRYIYLCDAPSREFRIMGRTLEFKRAPLKQAKFASPQTELITQALLALGEAHVETDVLTKIRQFISPKEKKRILQDSRHTPAWIGEILRKIITDTI